MYYNPETKETIERSELKKKYNVSIPTNIEEFNGWYLLNDGEHPQSSRNSIVIKSEITEVDGKYYQTYSLEELLPSDLQVKTRIERNRLLTEYVDPLVNNILKWEDLSSEEQTNISAYRRYLLDYPQSSDTWYETKPLTFQEWLDANTEN